MTATLARLRVTLGFASGVLVLLLARPTLTTLVAGAVIALIGESLRLWAAGHLNKAREVTVSGPYRFFAHPLYVGSSIMGAGFAIASARGAAAALVAIYLVLTIGAAIRSEESHLTEKFGRAYPEYREGRITGAPRRFSLARAWRNREYRSLVGVVVALALLLWKAL